MALQWPTAISQLLAQHYDGRGDASIVREALDELSMYYEEETSIREVRRDRGHTLLIPGEEVEQRYQDANQQFMLEHDYAASKAAVTLLRLECEENGLDTKIRQLPSARFEEEKEESPTAISPLLGAYYDAIGDMRIFQECLDLLDLDYKEMLASRELLRDLGHEPVSSDEDVEPAYLKERDGRLDQLRACEATARLLRIKCEEHGIDVEDVEGPWLPDAEMNKEEKEHGFDVDGHRLPGAKIKKEEKKKPEITLYEPEVTGRLGGIRTGCLPDTGADANCVSLSFLRRNRIDFDLKPCGRRSLPKSAGGTRMRPLGVVTLPFEFADETEKWSLNFYVFSTCAKDVILGSPFLRFTETLTRFTKRIVRKLRGTASHYVRFTGSSERVYGNLDGLPVGDAVPDSGSDIMLMSGRYARERDYHVDKDEVYRQQIKYIDGSRAWTSGIVRDVDWSYRGSEEGRNSCDFYVLEDLQCDVLLSYGFLYETDAWTSHADSMYQKEAVGDVDGPDNDCTLGTIIWLRDRLQRETQSNQGDEPFSIDDLGRRRTDLLERRDDWVAQVTDGQASLTMKQEHNHWREIDAWKRDWQAHIRDYQRKQRRVMNIKSEAYMSIDQELKEDKLTREDADLKRTTYDAFWVQEWRALCAVRPDANESAVVRR